MIGFSPYSAQGKDLTYLYTKGKEFSLDGKEYIGEYHLNGTEVKSGPIETIRSRMLYPYYENKDHFIYDMIDSKFNLVKTYAEPKPYIPTLNEAAYQAGSIERYFVRNIVSSKGYPLEINSSQFKNIGKFGGINPGVYVSVKLTWRITNSTNAFTLAEVRTFNKKEIVHAKKVIWDIDTILTTKSDYLQSKEQVASSQDRGIISFNLI